MRNNPGLKIITFLCPGCMDIMHAVDEEGCEVYAGKCDNCNATYEIADYGGEGRVRLKRVKVS